MVNSNVPHLRSLVSESCIEIIVQVKILILSSVRSDKHMMTPLSAWCERSDSSIWTPAATVRSYSFNPLWTMITTIFQEKSNTYQISEPIIGRFFPNLVLVRSFRSSFIDSFSSAKERCSHPASTRSVRKFGCTHARLWRWGWLNFL